MVIWSENQSQTGLTIFKPKQPKKKLKINSLLTNQQLFSTILLNSLSYN